MKIRKPTKESKKFKSAPLYMATINLTKALSYGVSKAPRELRYTLGRDMTRGAALLTHAFIEAYTEENMKEKRTKILFLSKCVKATQADIDMAAQLNMLDGKSYPDVAEAYDKVSRQTAGWLLSMTDGSSATKAPQTEIGNGEEA